MLLGFGKVLEGVVGWFGRCWWSFNKVVVRFWMILEGVGHDLNDFKRFWWGFGNVFNDVGTF